MPIILDGTTGIVSPKVNTPDLELNSVNVVERGSNANGEYVRFADGTQICTFRRGTHPITRTTQTWAAAFVNSEYIVGLVVERNTDETFHEANVRVRASASLDYQSNGPVSTHAVHLTAIGRWF